MLKMITRNSLLVEELLNTLGNSSDNTTVPREVSSDTTISSNSRNATQSHKLENEAKNDALDSRKAKASPTYAEISVKSFYGTPNINEQTVKPAVRVPIAVKSSKKMTVPNRRRYQNRRSMPRQPILGSIRANKLKTKKNKLSVSATKQSLLLKEIQKTIENASANRKKFFENNFHKHKHKQLNSGEYLLKKSEKSMVESMAFVASAEFETNHLSNEENQKEFDVEVKEQDELTKSLSATVEREDEVQLLSPPNNKVKKEKEEDYDELLLICNNVLDVFGQALIEPDRVDGDEQLLSPRRNKVRKEEKEYDELLSSRNEVVDDVKQLANNPDTVDGHDQLLSPLTNNVTNKNEEYDELLSIRKEVLDIVKQLSNNADKVDDQLKSGDDIIVPIESDSLRTNDMELSDNVSMYARYYNMIPYNTTDSDEIDRQQGVLELLIESGICNDENFKICIAEYEQYKDKAVKIINNLFEITSSSVLHEDNDMSASILQNDKIMNEQTLLVRKEHSRIHTKNDIEAPLPNKLFKWIPISDNQLQSGAGQKEFGTKTCNQCEMIHLHNDPEDEMLHKHFHNNMLGVLYFDGWKHENLVDTVKEWGNMGRIIWLNQADIESRVSKIKEILEIIDNDLELDNRNLTPDSIIYLAISRKLIIGVCVVEHLKHALQMSTKNQNDSEMDIPGKYPIRTDSGINVPVKCGISRIWVTPQYRRCGIATRLIKAVCSHFVRGFILSVNDIAFHTPTLMGIQFAQHIAEDVNVYDPVTTKHL